MSGKITRIDTGETETGAQNEPIPAPVHQDPQEAPVEPETPTEQPQE